MCDLTPLWLSVQLAVVTTGILFIIGVPLAYWLAMGKSFLRSWVDPLISLPLALPPTVLGFYLLLALSPKYLPGQMWEQLTGFRLLFSFPGLVIGSVCSSLPFMINPIKAAFESFPLSLIEASQVLGKSPARTLWQVILPNTRPAWLSGCIMVFSHTIGEFGVVLMIGGSIPGRTRVASIAIFSAVEALDYRLAHTYSLIMLAIALALLIVLRFINRSAARLL